MLVLSGDIGGTSTRLQLTQFNPEPKLIARAQYACSEHPSLEAIIDVFLAAHSVNSQQIEKACFAVAGPIVNGTVKFTNLPWYVDEVTLKQRLNLDKVKLINDFQAIGYGVPTLKDQDMHCLQAAKTIAQAPKAIIGAGTGLGVAIMAWNGSRYEVLPTEGGHVDFAPVDDRQVALLQYLRKKYRRVSIERLVSGQGIVNIYNFERDHPMYGEKENPSLKLALHNQKEDAAALISEYATKHHDPIAMSALKMFVKIYGACAGDLALTTLPYGGLYIVGGIAPKLLAQLIDGRFMQAFMAKGRVANLLEAVPIHIVLDTNIGLQGAANYAFGL
jgi:glucokinase